MTAPWILFLTGIVLTVLSVWIFGGASNSKTAEAATLTYPLLSLGFGCIVASAMSPNFWLARWCIPGAKTIAALAFTLYLVHKQMIHMAMEVIGDPSENVLAVGGLSVVLILIASCTIHYGVEKPFLKLRDRILANRHST